MTTPTYPGVYVIELQSSLHPITGVSTSTTAFVGSAAQGPVNDPQTCNSWSDFVTIFGGLWSDSQMSYAVYQFFQNGGSTAVVVRVTTSTALAATIDLGNGVKLDAASAGAWGANLQASVDYNTSNPADTTLWNLTVQNTVTGQTERYLNVSTSTASAKSLANVLQASSLVVPDATAALDQRPPQAQDVAATGGGDGGPIGDADIDPVSGIGGIHALGTVDIFNILCIPAPQPGTDLGSNTLDDAVELCVTRRAMLLVDPPFAWNSVADAVTGMATPLITGTNAANAAMYFPRITTPDPLTGTMTTYSSCGAIAGVWARTDGQRGVWKAPAGTDRVAERRDRPAGAMTDPENGELNPLGVNCLRTSRSSGRSCGVRGRMRGADALARPVEVPAGPAHRAVHRGKPVPRHEVGGVRAERRAAVGVDPAQRRRVHEHAVPAGRLPGSTPDARPTSSSATARTTRRTTSTGGSSTSSSVSRRSSPLSSSSSTSSSSPASSRPERRTSWLSSRVNATRLDPYKNFKFRVKWDNQYVAGVSKVSTLKRTTEVVKHRDGGDESSSRKSPGRTEYDADHPGARRHPRRRRSSSGPTRCGTTTTPRPRPTADKEVSLADFRKDIIIDVFNEAGQKVLSYQVYRCWVSEYQALPDLDANANAVAIQHIKLENEGWIRDTTVTEPTEPTFTDPAA